MTIRAHRDFIVLPHWETRPHVYYCIHMNNKSQIWFSKYLWPTSITSPDFFCQIQSLNWQQKAAVSAGSEGRTLWQPGMNPTFLRICSPGCSSCNPPNSAPTSSVYNTYILSILQCFRFKRSGHFILASKFYMNVFCFCSWQTVNSVCVTVYICCP